MLIALTRPQSCLVLTLRSWWLALRLAQRYGGPDPTRFAVDPGPAIGCEKADTIGTPADPHRLEPAPRFAVLDRLTIGADDARSIGAALAESESDLPDTPRDRHAAGSTSLLEEFGGDGRTLIHNLARLLGEGEATILGRPEEWIEWCEWLQECRSESDGEAGG